MIDILEFARGLAENKGAAQQLAIKQALKMLRDAKVIDPGWPADKTSLETPDLFAKIYPEISLPEEHRRQALISIVKGYAQKLNMSPEDYIKSLPDFSEKPSTYDGLGLTRPLIVETRIPWLEAAELSGIYVSDYMREQMSAGRVRDWEGINFAMPKVPFTVWIQDGTKFVFRKPSDVRRELGMEKNKEYFAGTILPVIAMNNVRPDMVITMGWDIIGINVGSGGVAALVRWHDGLELDAGDAGIADPGYRALVLGREIRTLNLAA